MLTLVPNGTSPAAPARPTTIDPIGRVVGQAFALACETVSPPNEERLRDLVFLFVTRLRAMRVPPERVLIAMKAAISSVGDTRHLSLAQSLSGTGNPIRHRTYRRVFEWLLEAYFG